MALLEERKKKLAAEGLFDEARKQLLPFLPRVIGVVTSPTGAVIRDILHRLADRFPRRVLVWPVRVQGETSAAEVAAAIRGFNALPEGGPMPRPDLIIVARGGGSLEDLWSFNEEIVVRAAADSMIPLISAVGHETDITLIDFAADRRAPTPTAAAEMAVPVRAELLARIADAARAQLACWQRGIEQRRTELAPLTRALPAATSCWRCRASGSTLAERLPRALRANAQLHHTQYSRVATRLAPQLLRNTVERRRERYDNLTRRLRTSLVANAQAHQARIARSRDRVNSCGNAAQRAMLTLLDQRGARLERAERLLAAFSYRGVLERGFALVRDGDGSAAAQGRRRAERRAARHRVCRRPRAAVADGEGKPTPPAAAPRPKPRPRSEGGGPSGQGSLFGLSGVSLPRCRTTILGRKATEAALLNRYDRSSPMAGEAEVKFLDGDFRVVRPGAFVRCAVTGVPIPLEELKYWSVDLPGGLCHAGGGAAAAPGSRPSN